MANVYVDLDKAASTEDGTTWANAYRLPSEISVAAGDDVWIKGSTNQHSGSTLTLTFGTDSQNPARVHGVKSATTNEPPVQSDLIPGWRTGEARTIANRAYKDADRPIIGISDSSQMRVQGQAFIYGVEFTAANQIHFPRNTNDSLTVEECLISPTGSNSWLIGFTGPMSGKFMNCGFDTNNTGASMFLSAYADVIGLEYIGSTAATGGLLDGPQRSGQRFIGCDFTNLGANPLFQIASADAGECFLQNCLLHASTTIVTGAKPNGFYRVELQLTDSTTGKSSGTITNIDITTESGNIVEETTAVRTGGASDGSTSYSHAFTPDVNGTRDQYKGLEGPWMAFKVSGDGTSKTVTVYIANSGAADYNDDDVWLEIMYPSEGGTAQYDNQTTQMDLLGTPSAVTDDTTSTWGTGGNNPQKLQATIAPDYVGRAYCRVVFAKNFASSPETLYVDPLPEVA